MCQIINAIRWVPASTCSLCVLTLALVGCGGGSDEGQTVTDVLSSRSSSLSSLSSSSSGVGGECPSPLTLQ